MRETKIIAKRLLYLGLGVVLLFCGVAQAEQSGNTQVQLQQSPGGGLLVPVEIDGSGSELFLFDTGAALSVISGSLRKRLQQLPGTTLRKTSRRVAAAMADGRYRAMNVYELQSVSIGAAEAACQLGSFEVLVAERSERSILGLNALASTSGIRLDFAANALEISGCANMADAEAARVAAAP